MDNIFIRSKPEFVRNRAKFCMFSVPDLVDLLWTWCHWWTASSATLSPQCLQCCNRPQSHYSQAWQLKRLVFVNHSNCGEMFCDRRPETVEQPFISSETTALTPWSWLDERTTYARRATSARARQAGLNWLSRRLNGVILQTFAKFARQVHDKRLSSQLYRGKRDITVFHYEQIKRPLNRALQICYSPNAFKFFGDQNWFTTFYDIKIYIQTYSKA